MLEQGRVRVNGHASHRSTLALAPGDRVEIGGRSRSHRRIAGLELVYEDDSLLVIEKPSGLLTVATRTESERTAHALLRAYVAERALRRKVFVVHRLDRFASGLLVFALSPGVKARLQALFKAHDIERRYWAIVEGRVARDSGTLRSRLVEGKDLKMRSTDDPDEGKEAITHFRVLRRASTVTTLEVRLETGRKNQIRAQLAESGHPIVGDRAYGGGMDSLGRLALHAFLLGFRHPVTGEELRFKTAPPPEFARYLPGER
jgi:23S rRNA pseudouridine1911/1915/1917 synthase